MSFTCRPRGVPCMDDVCRSMNDCAWEPDETWQPPDEADEKAS